MFLNLQKNCPSHFQKSVLKRAISVNVKSLFIPYSQIFTSGGKITPYIDNEANCVLHA